MENGGPLCSRMLDEPSSTGLSVLADPKKPTLDIVFVHGFKGHPVRTWTRNVIKDRSERSADGCQRPAKKPRLSAMTPFLKERAGREDVYWPRDLIPGTLPTARVLVYGYDTNVRHSLGSPISKNTVYDIASDFLQSLEAARRSQPARPLIFVAHSLGGIVVKEALRQSQSFSSHHIYLHQIYESTVAILFFGTPHGGADPRGPLEHIAEKAIRTAGFTVNKQVLKSLLPSSERLKELRDEFTPMAHQNKWVIYSFQEQYGVPLLQGKKVVEDVSSCLGDSSLEITQHIASNHMDMCRFGGFDDIEYRKVVAAFERVQIRSTEKSTDPASTGTGLVLSENRRQFYMESLWYKAIDARHMTIKKAHTRTCRWLLEKSEYQDWLDANKTIDHHGVLWIRGKPGSGKSTLMKFLIANMQKPVKETIIVSFFFNARGEDLEKSTLGMYRSLVFQVLKAYPDLQIVLDSLRSTAPEGESYKWEEDNLQVILEAAIQSLGHRYLVCFIDALDECDERQIRDLVAFLEQLGQVATSSNLHFHVCLSSRHYPHVSIRNGIEMTLQDQDGHFQDIKKYLSSELKVGHSVQVEIIKEEILQRSSGIFLWVVLVVQILNKEYDHGRKHTLRRRLMEIPDGLDKLFEDILMRDQENKEELLLCLQYILYARRPLKREEIYHAILYETDPEAISICDAEEITTQDMDRFILSCSKGLAETTKLKAQTVQFIHESVRDFLLGKNGLNKLKFELSPGLSQDRLKQCCNRYLAIDTSEYVYPGMELPTASSERAKGLCEKISKRFPFLEYAVHNVLYHADVANGQGIPQKAFMKEFFTSHWIMLDNVFEKYQIRRHTLNASLLYIVAEKSFSNLVRTQLEREPHPGSAGERLEVERYAAPLYAALASADVSEDTIQAFLIPGAPTSHGYSETPTTQSVGRPDCSIAAIQTLVKKRPNIDTRKGGSLIDWAASNGHEAVVRFLLTKGDIDPNVSKDCRSPFLLAVSNGHEGLVRLFLVNDKIDPNSKDDDGRTALSLAVKTENVDLVRLLLAQNADPESKDNKFGQTPLLRAARGGHETIVRLLLAENVDPESKDNKGQTPLSIAARRGHETIVRLLLAKNVNPESKDNNGQTPLLKAAENGYEAVVRLLLTRKDIDPNIKDRYGLTPLLSAAIYGHEEIVRLLLAQNADPESKDNKFGQTPLSIAARGRHETIVRLLLAGNVDPESKDNDGQTPLMVAAEIGHESIVRLLLEQENVDMESKDNRGRTPLAWAEAGGHEAIVNLLQLKWMTIHSGITNVFTDRNGSTG